MTAKGATAETELFLLAQGGAFPDICCDREQERAAPRPETATVRRSHLSARHLLQQIESDRSKRAKRDIRPEWLTAFVECAAELFEPVAEVGRVGFDCRLDEQGWSAALYLGAVEVVGGKSDGQTEQPDFRFDLKALLEQFSRVDALVWNVLDHARGQPRRAAALVPVGRRIPRRESTPAGGPFVGSSTRRSRPAPPGRRALRADLSADAGRPLAFALSRSRPNSCRAPGWLTAIRHIRKATRPKARREGRAASRADVDSPGGK